MSTHLAQKIGIASETKWDSVVAQLGKLELHETDKNRLLGAVNNERIGKYITPELRKELRTVGVKVE